MNKVILLGNLTRDPELRNTTNSSVCNFRIAVSRKYGEKEEVAYIDCECWSNLAEVCNKYLKKGSKALVEGRLKQETWEDKETGAKRSKLVVVCDGVEFLTPKTESVTAPDSSDEDDDSDTPF